MPKNPDDVLLWENPGMLDSYAFENPPKKRRKARRNPSALALPKSVEGLMMGVGMEEIVGGGAGLLASTALPRMVIPTEPVTTLQKATRVAASVAATIAAGFVANAIAGRKAARAAIIGGLGGTALTAINTLTPLTLGGAPGQSVRRVLATGNPISGNGSRVGTKQPGFEGIRLY